MIDGTVARTLDRDWVRLSLIAWVGIAIYYVAQRWTGIHYLQLGDTDDNMRLMQVRAWLGGQGWYDLRQYRLNPPLGFDMHWSRLVDLPLAGLIVLLRPFVGPREAEMLACGIAPLLPLGIVLLGLGATVRRLVSVYAWPLGIVLLLCCSATMLMYMPERIDHHGWQLAMLSLAVAGLSDPKGARGGAIVGVASAVSLTIGLEMLPYAALAGSILTLRWIWDRSEAPRLAIYALCLGAGSGLGYALFASYADAVLRCDALTPVWLSVMVLAGALLFAMGWANPANRWVRLGLAIAAGAIIVVGFALVFPQCLGRPEQASPELQENWLNMIREAKPIYSHPFRVAFPVAVMPIVGVIGAAVATWRARGTALGGAWATVLLFVTGAALLLLWQARAGPAAQMLSVPGAVALGWLLIPMLQGSRSALVRVLGTAAAIVLIGSGLFAGLAIRFLPIDRPSKRVQIIDRASGQCPTMTALRPLDRYPAQTIFSFIDLGPRIITITHHDAIAGPYHRNGAAILDVQHAFSGSPENFRAIAKRHGATLLLVCPNMAESTIYRVRAPGGFYDQLAHRKTFDWLEELPMPAKSPLRLWRIKG
ncbi:AcrB/AcrD/AcrF family protein [Sphingomonas glacialis]|uniref:AcrB/AcrD/AcrF family protein n=1 Tax=Sphingomonas glacialis TaxID=658225 RepID=A0A502FTC7_9SPHN|nr:AcrB/AcrD/AcrF family protein [Sphingomonas glacialis]TPG52857.1 AcrB/AcrD/AcrF family protein [Sphingomonas glacialis]